MEVRIEDVSAVEKKLIVQVPWETVSTKLGEAYRSLAKNVQLKGFRKGKVPRSVLEQMFGKRVRAEVAVDLVRESFITAATEHDLDAVSEPRVDDELNIKKGEPFQFEAIVEVKGVVEAKDYVGMELNKRPLKVADESVQQALVQLQRENTELLPIEDREQLADTDFVAISLKGKIGEQEVDQPQLTVDLGDPDNQPFPGLVEALIGISINAKDHSIKITVVDDHPDESLRGTTGEFIVSVIDAKFKDTPKLDDEFAKDTGRAEDLDGLRAELREKLEKQMADQIETELRDAALKELIKLNPIPVASSLTERAIESKFRRLQTMLGLQPDAMSLTDDMREKLREGATDEVRGQLLLEAVSDKEKIEATEDNITERITEIAEAQSQQPARLRAEMDRDGRLDNLKFQLLQEKTLDYLVGKATVTEKEPEVEEPKKSEEPSAEAAAPKTDEGAESESEDNAEAAAASSDDTSRAAESGNDE